MAPLQKVAFLAVLLSGCTAAPICVTRCGLTFQGVIDGSAPPEGWSCDAIQDQEDSALEAFKSVTDPKFGTDVCSRFQGYQIWMHTDEIRYVSKYDGKWNLGESWCWENQSSDGFWGRHMLVAKTQQPKLGSMSHELAHIAQRCEPADHSDWTQYNIWDAVEKAQEP